METGKLFRAYAEGNYYDGYRSKDYLVRDNFKTRNIGQVSPRNSRGQLLLRNNLYIASSQIAAFTPGKVITEGWFNRDGKPVYLTNTRYWYPEYWTNPVRHLNTSKSPYPDNQALRKLFDAILENKASMAVTFAERQSAIDMASEKVIRVFNAYRHIKRGNFQKGARALGIRTKKPRSKQASGQWLELQYGWLPLISDAYTLLNFKPFAGDYIKGRARDTVEYTSPLGSRVVHSKKVEYGCHVLVTDPMVGFANQAGLLNPALVVWELVPFSFVVDWFLPVGDHLDYLTALCGLSISDGYKSVVDEYHLSFSGDNGLSIASTNKNINRTLFTQSSLGIPKLRPTNPISPMHIANAIALGRQLKKE